MSIASIREVFGPQALSQGLFYANAPALRFELSQSGQAIDLFLQAIDRARAVASKAFQDSKTLTCVLTLYTFNGEADWKGIKRELSASFRALRLTKPNWEDHFTEPTDDPETKRAFLSCTLPNDELSRLLWGVFAQELGVRPRLRPCQVYLADAERGILLHPYDDRGLDIIGPNRALLSHLYTKFNDWLLDYDRERMNVFFATSEG